MEPQYTLQTVERALSFLEHVAGATTPPTIRDVSQALDLNVTTCYHLLRTLTARRYIARRPDGSLELGDGVGALLRNYRRPDSIDSYLSGVVERLAAQTLETSFLSIREENNVVLKVLVEGSQRLRVAGLYVGLKGHEHRRAAGKAVLAHLDDEMRGAILDASLADMPGRQRQAARKALARELPQTVTRGWSMDDQTEHGIVSVGVPIFHANGEVLGAVGIVAPATRMDRSRDTFLNLVIAAAAEANRLMKDVD